MTYYELLGVKPDASLGDMAAAWRKFVRRHHPDVDRRPDSVAHFQKVSKAWETLRQPRRRALYDKYGEDYESIIPTVGGNGVLELYGF